MLRYELKDVYGRLNLRGTGSRAAYDFEISPLAAMGDGRAMDTITLPPGPAPGESRREAPEEVCRGSGEGEKHELREI